MRFNVTDISGDIALELVGDSLTITPKPDAFGMKEIDINVTDDSWEVHFTLPVNISPADDGIELLSINGTTPLYGVISLEVEHERLYSFPIEVEDVDGDLDEVSVIHNSTGITVNLSSMKLDINLTVDAGINTTFTLTGMDLNGSTFEQSVFINILNVPHTPYGLIITSPENGTLGFGNWLFNATAMDPDLPWGDVLIFNWSSDVDGHLGYGSELEYIGLTPGDHVIEVNVSDSYGFWVKDTIEVEVHSFVFFMKPDEWESTVDLDFIVNEKEVKADIVKNGSTSYVTETYTFSGTYMNEISIMFLQGRTFKKGTDPSERGDFARLEKFSDAPPSMKIQKSTVHEDGNWSIMYSYEYEADSTNISSIMNQSHEFAITAWTADGLYNILLFESNKTVNVDDITPDGEDIDTDIDTDTDTDTEDNIDEKEKNSLVIWLLIGVFILVLCGILVFFILSRKKKNDDEEE